MLPHASYCSKTFYVLLNENYLCSVVSVCNGELNINLTVSHTESVLLTKLYKKKAH
jgi:hypothetical protein